MTVDLIAKLAPKNSAFRGLVDDLQVIPSFTSTPTAAGTTTLTVASSRIQEFTGSTTQTVVLPVVSTLVTGWEYIILNNSTGVVTVNSSGGNAVQAMAAGTWMIVRCILITGTSAASWSKAYSGGGSVSSHDHNTTDGTPKLTQANTHESPDTDSATSSLHHTIGATATTAAAGNHSHAAEGHILIIDSKPQNTHGGTFTSGLWRVRDLNAIVYDTYGDASLSYNQVTLAAGTYRFHIQAPAAGVDSHMAALYNVTTSLFVATGTSEFAWASDFTTGWAQVKGRFTIASSAVFEVQHKCQTTVSNYGFGYRTNFTTERYTMFELWKEV